MCGHDDQLPAMLQHGAHMISCRGLTRRFGDFVAVDAISFEVPAGAICAFLGPNGAGKSTTVKMLTGLLQPTAGEAHVAGIDAAHDPVAVKRAVGVLPENLGLFDALTVEEHLALSGAVYGIPPHETRERTTQLLRVLALEEARYVYASECSHGMRKKTALAMALLHNPRVLFLDEPFEGIDPVTSRAILDLLEEVARHGVTVFLTSHILSIVEKLATRIIILQQGRIAWNSPPSDLPRALEQHYFDLLESHPAVDLPWLGPSRS
jgi:ABC-2 type transport system ATP-binding protein